LIMWSFSAIRNQDRFDLHAAAQLLSKYIAALDRANPPFVMTTLLCSFVSRVH
jgi:hypothetical protein